MAQAAGADAVLLVAAILWFTASLLVLVKLFEIDVDAKQLLSDIAP
ncbi:MAG: hypothetical protein V7K45_11560 [Nostoc sp.]